MSNITITNRNEATDNCPGHNWLLIDEGKWECSYCGAIGTDEDFHFRSIDDEGGTTDAVYDDDGEEI